ncbi:MAG: LacI family DNA-binding transcriptional regulator [Galactobacter sp.]
MHDVAVAAGVSTSTVSRALRGQSNVRPDTAARVRAVAEGLGFTVTASASGLASGKVKRIAMLLGSPLTDWFSGEILDAIVRVVRGAGYDLLLYRVHGAKERESFFRTMPARRNADAMIVASFRLLPDEQATLARIGIPLVYLNQHVEGYPGVGMDDVAAGIVATRHLLARGYRRLIYLREELEQDFVWSAQDRLTGFRAAVATPDTAVDARVVQVRLAEEFQDGLAHELAAEAENTGYPVGVLAENDTLALRLLYGLRRARVDVPGQVGVVGFDGQEWGQRMGLTTVVQPVQRLAAAAAEIAHRLARAEPTAQDWEGLALPTGLREADSPRAGPRQGAGTH